jgi:hypothetical protein
MADPILSGTFHDGIPDRVVLQGEVRFARARCCLLSYRSFEGAGFSFRNGYDIPETVVPVRNSSGKQIGTATLEPQTDGLWAEVAFDYSTPERLEAEVKSLYALPKGKLHLPAQVVPACIDTEDGPARFPLFDVTCVSVEAVILTSRTQSKDRSPVEIVEDA